MDMNVDNPNIIIEGDKAKDVQNEAELAVNQLLGIKKRKTYLDRDYEEDIGKASKGLMNKAIHLAYSNRILNNKNTNRSNLARATELYDFHRSLRGEGKDTFHENFEKIYGIKSQLTRSEFIKNNLTHKDNIIKSLRTTLTHGQSEYSVNIPVPVNFASFSTNSLYLHKFVSDNLKLDQSLKDYIVIKSIYLISNGKPTSIMQQEGYSSDFNIFTTNNSSNVGFKVEDWKYDSDFVVQGAVHERFINVDGKNSLIQKKGYFIIRGEVPTLNKIKWDCSLRTRSFAMTRKKRYSYGTTNDKVKKRIADTTLGTNIEIKPTDMMHVNVDFDMQISTININFSLYNKLIYDLKFDTVETKTCNNSHVDDNWLTIPNFKNLHIIIPEYNKNTDIGKFNVDTTNIDTIDAYILRLVKTIKSIAKTFSIYTSNTKVMLSRDVVKLIKNLTILQTLIELQLDDEIGVLMANLNSIQLGNSVLYKILSIVISNKVDIIKACKDVISRFLLGNNTVIIPTVEVATMNEIISVFSPNSSPINGVMQLPGVDVLVNKDVNIDAKWYSIATISNKFTNFLQSLARYHYKKAVDFKGNHKIWFDRYNGVLHSAAVHFKMYKQIIDLLQGYINSIQELSKFMQYNHIITIPLPNDAMYSKADDIYKRLLEQIKTSTEQLYVTRDTFVDEIMTHDVNQQKVNGEAIAKNKIPDISSLTTPIDVNSIINNKGDLISFNNPISRDNYDKLYALTNKPTRLAIKDFSELTGAKINDKMEAIIQEESTGIMEE